MLIVISFIGLVISFIILTCASDDDIRGKGANIKLYFYEGKKLMEYIKLNERKIILGE